MGGSPGLVIGLSWKIQVSSRKDASIHIIVDGLSREHDFTGIVRADMVNGLAPADQGGDKGVELKCFGSRNADTGKGFRAEGFILLLGKARGVDMLFEGTSFSFRAAIADIGRLG